MFGGRVIQQERDWRGTSTTEVVQAQSANVVLEMGNGVRLEIPINPQILLTTMIENGSSYQDPYGAFRVTAPDRIHLAKIEVQPAHGDVIVNMFKDFQEAEEPHDEMCDCGNHRCR